MTKQSAPLLFLMASTLACCAKEDPVDVARTVKPEPAVAAPPAKAPPAPTARAPEDIAEPAVRVPIDGLPAFGSARAPVTIVLFSDYECPYCARADARLTMLRGEYGERVRLVIASRPLPIHDRAPAAARAFLAAVDQGKGEAMHARLFAGQESLDEAGLRAAATDVGLDLDAFDRARRGKNVDDALRASEELADGLHVEGTPTIFVNGRRFVGARPIDALRAAIDEELEKAAALVSRGVAPELVYETILKSAPEAARPSRPADVVRNPSIEGAPVRGPSGAPTTIVFFSDFECPYCVKAEGVLRQLEAADPGKVKIAFRHRPLKMHPHAWLAAKASLAAERQGQFWPYHDVLVRHRDALEREDLERYASEVGLNPARFARDLDDPALDARIAADSKEADTLEVKGTPTAFVNGVRVVGAQPLATWQNTVAVAQARR